MSLRLLMFLGVKKTIIQYLLQFISFIRFYCYYLCCVVWEFDWYLDLSQQRDVICSLAVSLNIENFRFWLFFFIKIMFIKPKCWYVLLVVFTRFRSMMILIHRPGPRSTKMNLSTGWISQREIIIEQLKWLSI